MRFVQIQWKRFHWLRFKLSSIEFSCLGIPKSKGQKFSYPWLKPLSVIFPRQCEYPRVNWGEDWQHIIFPPDWFGSSSLCTKRNMTGKQMSLYCLHLRFTERAISRFSVGSIYLSPCFIECSCCWIKRRRKGKGENGKDCCKNSQGEQILWSVRMGQIQLCAISLCFYEAWAGSVATYERNYER